MNEYEDKLVKPTIVVRKVTETKRDLLFERIAGCLFGAAIADSLGWVTEFMRSSKTVQKYGVDRIRDFVTWDKKTGGIFYTYIDAIQPGEYSDDTQLVLCTARSIEKNGQINNDYFSKIEMVEWLSYARGAGATITRAARELSKPSKRWNDNFFKIKTQKGYFEYRQAGANGAAMRIAPIVLANYDSEESIYPQVWKNSIVTHGHPRAIIGALVYAKALCLLFRNGKTEPTFFVSNLQKFISELKNVIADSEIKDWVKVWDEGADRKFLDVFGETQKEMSDMLNFISKDQKIKLTDIYGKLGCLRRETRGSGTASVAAALALYLRFHNDYEKAVVEAVNIIGSDTDTIGSMTGGLIGINSGYTVIPERLATRLQDYNYFIRLATTLSRISLREKEIEDLRFPSLSQKKKEYQDVIGLMRSNQISQNRHVSHKIFGPGKVISVDSQQMRRKDAGLMKFARIVFDIGQSCKFKVNIVKNDKITKKPQKNERDIQGDLFS